MVTPGAKREAVAHAREHHGVSERRACALVGVSRRVIRYEPTRPDDGALRQRLRELAAERRRFGYRRLGYLLAREGITPNHKKLLRVRRRGGRKRGKLGVVCDPLGEAGCEPGVEVGWVDGDGPFLPCRPDLGERRDERLLEGFAAGGGVVGKRCAGGRRHRREEEGDRDGADERGADEERHGAHARG